jgi:serine protease Do
MVKLAERPRAEERAEQPQPEQRRVPSSLVPGGGPLGLTVRELDASAIRRLSIPKDIGGVLVSRVEPMSPAYDASIERGQVIMDVNRQRLSSVAQYHRIIGAALPGDVLAFYLYTPGSGERTLRTIRVEP